MAQLQQSNPTNCSAVAAVVWPLEAIAIRELGLAIDAAIEDCGAAEGTPRAPSAIALVDRLEHALRAKADEVLGRPARTIDDLLVRAALALAYSDKGGDGRPVVNQSFIVERAAGGLLKGVFDLLEPRALPVPITA